MNLPRLKQMRENKNLKQVDIANVLGVKQQQYSEYEIGKRLIPIDYLSALADFYNTSIDYLLGKTDEIKIYPKPVLRNNPFKNFRFDKKPHLW